MRHDTDTIKKVYCDPLFERTLKELRSKGGYAAVAARKAEAFIAVLCGGAGAGETVTSSGSPGKENIESGIAENWT